MRFGIGIETDTDAEKNIDAVQAFADGLSSFMSDAETGVDELIIGFTCLNRPKGYESWYKPRRPKFSKGILTFDINFSNIEYKKFVASNTAGAKQMFATTFLAALEGDVQLPKSASAFEVRKFSTLVRMYAKETGVDIDT